MILLWIGVFVLLAGSALIFSLIAKGKIGYMPPIAELENPIDKYASQVISEDGKVLGSFALKNNNRIFITYDQLSPHLVNALIATEDKRFADHSGIDFQGLMRAVIKTGLLRQKQSGGGSTISQQLAKQLYSPQADNIFERALQKPIEWVIAVELERYYTKEEIVNLYLNKFDFLYQAVGIESAAKTYFNKTPKELTVEEAATLVGMCKNPSLYNPIRYPDRTRNRRNTVLDLMRRSDHLSQAECDSLSALPLKTEFSVRNHRAGNATYFREFIKKIMMAEKPKKRDYRGWMKEQYQRDSLAWETQPLYGWCHKNQKSDGTPYNIYTDGLKIYTGINSKMQQYAEDAVYEHFSKTLQPEFVKEKKSRKTGPFSNKITDEERESLITRSIELSDRYRHLSAEGMSKAEILKTFDIPTEMTVFSYEGPRDTIMTPRDSILYYKSFLRTGFMAMDPRNGHVKAYVGGVNYGAFQYDMVTSGRRQVGSVMKPLLYAMAMNEGFTPCDQMMHVQPQLLDEAGRVWAPRNPGAKRVGEMVSIDWGLQVSDNWVTAWLMSQLSPYTFVELLHSFGITGHLDPVVSICLGTPDISVSEMVSAFTTFSNGGIRTEPMFVTRIEDQYGNVLANFAPKMNEVLPEEATYKTLYMLRNVMNGGTGSRVRFRYNVQADMGGKTGTTQNNSDGWFICFTPSLTAGCWVGGEDRSIHFDRMAHGQGASMALPVVALFYQKVYADRSLGYDPGEKFIIPAAYTNPCKSSIEDNSATTINQEGIDSLFE